MSDIDPMVRAVFAGVLNTLWIAAALAVLAWTAARWLPRTNAATRHLLWWTVLALVLFVPFAAVDRGWLPEIASSATAATSNEAPPAAPIPSVPDTAPSQAVFPLQVPAGDWLLLAVALWALFGFVQFIRIAWSFLYLLKIKGGAHGAPEDLTDRFRYWVQACGIGRPVRLLISERIASPMATGFRHPAVILPTGLLTQFGGNEIDHVLLHELAHVDRRDDWTNLAARCAGAIVGLHPVAAWVLRQIVRERELACDDWVVTRTGEARPYAASLAHLFEVCSARRRAVLATGMAGSASQLGERIEILLDSRRQFTSRASLMRIGLTAAALLALVAAGAHAPRWVVLAQSSPASPARELPRNDTAVNPRGSFLAALVAAGYGGLPVDEIIALKEHGIDARFLAGVSQSGWERIAARDLIALHEHGVPPDMLSALHDGGFRHLEIREIVDAWEKGVRQETLRDAAQYGSHLTLAQIVKLKQAGVIQ